MSITAQRAGPPELGPLPARPQTLTAFLYAQIGNSGPVRLNRGHQSRFGIECSKVTTFEIAIFERFQVEVRGGSQSERARRYL